MNDLVERLRNDDDDAVDKLLNEAADEIERLRGAASDVVRHDMLQDQREGMPTSVEVLHLRDVLTTPIGAE
jgi:hypothetical protein